MSSVPSTLNHAETNTLTELLGLSEGGQKPQTYLTYLTTLPLASLKSEPTLLQTQSHHLTSSLTSLTHTSYPNFLHLHETTKSLSKSLSDLQTSLDDLISTSLPALEESAAAWPERTEHVLTERKKARVVLEQHDKLRDLLDIPVLIDTCVRNGYFAEALSLASHTNSLSSSTNTLILTSILSEVHNSIAQMLLSLLTTLHEPNRKLPALWKAINFLRKMDAFSSDSEEGGIHSEEQIALAFITGRESCLKTSLEGGKRDIQRLVGAGGDIGDRDREDITKYLKKYIDTWREGVYDIVTQYTTIFLDRPAGSVAVIPERDALPRLHTLLSTYASHALQTHLLPLLEFTLPYIPLPSLPSLLTQLTYCATAFGRVGLDFRGVLNALFCNAVLTGVSADIRDAGAKWQRTIKSNLGEEASSTTSSNIAPSTMKRKTSSSLVPTMPSKFLIAASAIASPPTLYSSSSSSSMSPSSSSTFTMAQPHIPPQLLSSYPPLAVYTNALLSTLNNLRLLAPLSLARALQSVLDTSLAESGDVLLLYVRAVLDDKARRSDVEIEREERIALAAGEVFFEVLVPFVRRAMGEGVFGVKGNYKLGRNADELGDEEDDASMLVKVIKEWDVCIGGRKATGEVGY